MLGERRDFCHLVKISGILDVKYTETQLKSGRRRTCCWLLTHAVGPSSLCPKSVAPEMWSTPKLLCLMSNHAGAQEAG